MPCVSLLRITAFIVLVALPSCPGCPPPTPGPSVDAALSPDLCNLSQNTYDNLSDKIVTALGDDLSWESQINVIAVENTKAVVLCMMKNIAADLQGAPVEKSRAQDWIAKQETP